MGTDRRYKYTEDEIKEIQNLYYENSRKHMMEYLKLSENELRHVFKKYNIKKTKPVDSRAKDFNYLYQEYVINNKSALQISKELCCGKDTILIYLKKLGFRIKTAGESNRNYTFTKDELENEYITLKKSISKISKKFKVGRQYISRCLKYHNIKHKSMSEVQFDIKGKERPIELYQKDWLIENYIDKKRSRKDLAEELNTTPDSILLALNEFDIPIRNNSESKVGLMSGEKHHNWKGVANYYMLIRQYIFDYIKPKVFDRDNNTCVICEETENLHHHHIFEYNNIISYLEDKFKDELDFSNSQDRYKLFEFAKNDDIINDISNIITVCSYCHWNVIHGVDNKEERKYLMNYDEYVKSKED